MDSGQIANSIQLYQEQLNVLLNKQESELINQPNLLFEVIEELSVALEELHVQQEELILANLQLELEHQRYQELFDFAPDAYLVTDGKGVIHKANRAAATMLNVREKMLVGKPLTVFIPRGDIYTFHNKLAQQQEWGYLQDWQLCLQPRNGQPFPVAIAISASKDDQDKELVQLRWIIRDMSIHKQAEAKREKALAKEKELNQLKSHFINSVSHQFRTPLTVILVSTEILENYSDKLTQDKKTRYLQKIKNAVQRTTNLLEDILVYEKADVSREELELENLNLETFCHNLLEELSSSSQTGQRIGFHSEGDCFFAWLDAELLKQILTNLLSNALNYSPQDSIVNFDLICRNNQAVFTIQDRGIGIPLADQSQIFEPLYRGKNASTVPGSGLGLATVKKLVDLHDGVINFETEEGVGSTFTVTLLLE